MVNLFYVNRKIQIKPSDSKEYYLYLIRGLVDDKLYVVPASDRIFNFSLKEEVEIKIAEVDAIYLFRTTVLYVKDQGRRYASYILEKPKQVQRVQNRKFVRIPVSINVSYAELKANEEKLSDEEGLALNLSGSGMRLATSSPLIIGSILLLYFVLDFAPDKIKINAKGMAIREHAAHLEKSISQWKYHYGISFINIPTKLQDAIVRYVIKQISISKGRFSIK